MLRGFVDAMVVEKSGSNTEATYPASEDMCSYVLSSSWHDDFATDQSLSVNVVTSVLSA